MVNLVDEVISFLKADSVISGIVSNRVYWIKPSTKAPQFPLLTVMETGNTEIESSDDEEYIDQIDIQVDIFIQGDFRPLAKQVQKVMRSHGFTHSSFSDEWIEELEAYHKAIKFTIESEVI